MGGYRCLAAAWKLMLFHRSLQKRWKPLGASCGPLPPRLRGTRGVVSWGWFTPGEIRIPCRFVSRSRPTTILKHGGLSQSVTITTVLGVAIPCHTQFWAIFSGVFLGINISMFFFESCWWLWLSLQSRWQQIDKRRGRAHPQCWWAWQPSEMGHARHSCNNWPAEAKRRFRIITASFWYQLMFSSGNKPMTIADRWRLEIQKSPSTS